MGAPRKNPPPGAAEKIESLAEQNWSIVGIAKFFEVSRETFKRWCEDNEAMQDAFDTGREIARQRLVSLITEDAKARRGPNVNAFFLLKTMHGFRENDSNTTKVEVGLKTSNVLVVPSAGSDDEWEARALAQQTTLVNASASPASLPSATAVVAQPARHPEPQTIILDHSLISPIQPKAPAWDADSWRPKS